MMTWSFLRLTCDQMGGFLGVYEGQRVIRGA